MGNNVIREQENTYSENNGYLESTYINRCYGKDYVTKAPAIVTYI
jgi:hypothetical protein